MVEKYYRELILIIVLIGVVIGMLQEIK